nr:acyloxyacyl hydrolase [Marinicella sp. W31]MDC2877146.1 acyloxyacyl hydrolase [Marinicella sp. W31]
MAGDCLNRPLACLPQREPFRLALESSIELLLDLAAGIVRNGALTSARDIGPSAAVSLLERRMCSLSLVKPAAIVAYLALGAGSVFAADAEVEKAPAPVSQDSVFDEARFEVAASLGTDSDFEKGVFLIPSLFFDPLHSKGREGFDKFLHPRFFLSASISTADEASQIMAGASWKFPVAGPTFVDIGFGGALTNGSLDEYGGRGPGVGSHVLFHEYIAFGVDLDHSWSVTATVRHSSNADLASPNSGLTYGGLGIAKSF